MSLKGRHLRSARWGPVLVNDRIIILNTQDGIFQNMSSGLVDIGLDMAPRFKNKKKIAQYFKLLPVNSH